MVSKRVKELSSFVSQIKRSYTFTDRNVQRKRGISLQGDQGHRVKGSFE